MWIELGGKCGDICGLNEGTSIQFGAQFPSSDVFSLNAHVRLGLSNRHRQLLPFLHQLPFSPPSFVEPIKEENHLFLPLFCWCWFNAMTMTLCRFLRRKHCCWKRWGWATFYFWFGSAFARKFPPPSGPTLQQTSSSFFFFTEPDDAHLPIFAKNSSLFSMVQWISPNHFGSSSSPSLLYIPFVSSPFFMHFLRSLRKINLFGRIWFFTFPPSIFPFKMTWFDFFLNQGCAAHK